MRRYYWSIAIVLGCAFVGVTYWQATAELPFPPTEITEVQVVVDSTPTSPNEQSLTVHTTDQRIITSLLDQFREAELAPDHKCAERGHLALRHKSGKQQLIFIVPGHQDEYYELIANRTRYRIPRKKFVDTIKSLGIDLPSKC